MFYKNRHGIASRQLAEDAITIIQKEGWTQEDQDKLAEGALSDSTRTD